VITRIGSRLVAAGLVLVIVGPARLLGRIGLVDSPAVGWAVAAPFLVAGLGSGLVIAPNQTLALSEVPPRQGGAAGGVLQTGQRIGSAGRDRRRGQPVLLPARQHRGRLQRSRCGTGSCSSSRSWRSRWPSRSPTSSSTGAGQP
jgi:hypothetical protein